MNKVILIGRLTREPEVRYSAGENATVIARYTLAVDRKYKQEGQQNADFIQCIAFGKSAEFAEKYFRKGMKIAITGRIQTGSYTNKEGQKVYTTDVVIEEQEFAESKNASGADREARDEAALQQSGYKQSSMTTGDDGFMHIPDGIDEELPFN
ncbi:single-stranded DNA-binding protein [Lachnospiraceae bacterium OF09-6]|nr:single-stranded DNA-binding protein [Lachnospiraceae bacterium OF09-6]